MQEPNGVIDIVVEDEADAVRCRQASTCRTSRAPLTDWTCADQRLLRRAIPENRLRVYDIRELIDTLADDGSVLELRRAVRPGHDHRPGPHRGPAVGRDRQQSRCTSAARSIRDGSDKAARFMQLCEAFDIPVLSLSDTPGMMVGPEIEKTALVRHCSRLFIIGANLTVPILTIVLRKSYGLGALAMAGGSFQAGCSRSPGPPASSAAWGWRARSSSATATSWPPSPIPPSAARFRRDGRPRLRARQGADTATYFESTT